MKIELSQKEVAIILFALEYMGEEHCRVGQPRRGKECYDVRDKLRLAFHGKGKVRK